MVSKVQDQQIQQIRYWIHTRATCARILHSFVLFCTRLHLRQNHKLVQYMGAYCTLMYPISYTSYRPFMMFVWEIQYLTPKGFSPRVKVRYFPFKPNDWSITVFLPLRALNSIDPWQPCSRSHFSLASLF